MSNILCFTQDLPGEREWLKTQFPEFLFLETESSGKWAQYSADSDQNLLFELPFTDPVNHAFIKQLNAKTVKTIFQNKLSINTLGDNLWALSDQLLVHDSIKFDPIPDATPKSYMMFTVGRCGTKFIESVLNQTYSSVHHHYTLSPDPKPVVSMCANPNDVLLCLSYRRDWWKWILSSKIALVNGYYHYNSYYHRIGPVDWTKLKKSSITQQDLDLFEDRMVSIFNFWCNLRVCYPTHLMNLYVFEDIVDGAQAKTQHTKIPYNSADMILNHDEAKELFYAEYLLRWQHIEQRFLKHFKNMNINFSTTL